MKLAKLRLHKRGPQSEDARGEGLYPFLRLSWLFIPTVDSAKHYMAHYYVHNPIIYVCM